MKRSNLDQPEKDVRSATFTLQMHVEQNEMLTLFGRSKSCDQRGGSKNWKCTIHAREDLQDALAVRKTHTRDLLQLRRVPRHRSWREALLRSSFSVVSTPRSVDNSEGLISKRSPSCCMILQIEHSRLPYCSRLLHVFLGKSTQLSKVSRQSMPDGLVTSFPARAKKDGALHIFILD